jgi:hypothetical protein
VDHIASPSIGIVELFQKVQWPEHDADDIPPASAAVKKAPYKPSCCNTQVKTQLYNVSLNMEMI